MQLKWRIKSVTYKNWISKFSALSFYIYIYNYTYFFPLFSRQLRDVYNTHQNLYVDKLIPGKIGRQQFMETENMLNKKKEEFVEKISINLKSLQ